MAKTNLDEIVSFPAKVKSELYKNQNLVSLLINTPNADLESEIVEEKYDSAVLDYDYVDGITQDNTSFICIDTIISTPTGTIKDVYITILVGVSKGLMSLKGAGYVGTSGNRRDNIVREIDFSLRDSQLFGIGGLELYGKIEAGSFAGKDFACKKMVYKVPNFATAKTISR